MCWSETDLKFCNSSVAINTVERSVNNLVYTKWKTLLSEFSVGDDN